MDEPAKPDWERTSLERRLSAWSPAPDDLSSDAMLFAAGRASAHRDAGRILWPALSACLAIVAVGLGISWANEHAQRNVLARAVQQSTTVAVAERPLPDSDRAAGQDSIQHEGIPPASYLAARYALERGEWLETRSERSHGRPDSPAPPTLRAADFAQITDR